MPQANLIQTLTGLEPKTKAAKVREVMPVIEERIAAGVRLADILTALKAGGVDLTEATLKSYLYRYRQKQARAEEAAGPRARPGTLQSDAAPAVEARPSPHADSFGGNGTDSSEPAARGPLSMQELDRLMKPDPAEQAAKLARYERLAKQQRRSRT